jgi:hypothetical protein
VLSPWETASSTLRNIPFEKRLDSIDGKVTSASHLKSGTLLLEAWNEKQAEVLLKATLLGSHPVHVVIHR